MTLGTNLGHLGVLVNLFGTRLLLSNGNLFCLLSQPDLTRAPAGFIQALCDVVFSKTNLHVVTGEESDLQFTLLPPSDVLLTEELADTLRTSDTGTDLRVDWTDDCSLGFDDEQFFLVIVDEDRDGAR